MTKTELLDIVGERLKEIKKDTRLYYPVANVFVNAPLALIQLELETELRVLSNVYEQVLKLEWKGELYEFPG